ncbi:envelope glycoprotein [Listeria ivanovii FSL F6-596]|nr:envelope glycoprotein [Listeria ivanovii FSL F6-596]
MEIWFKNSTSNLEKNWRCYFDKKIRIKNYFISENIHKMLTNSQL